YRLRIELVSETEPRPDIAVVRVIGVARLAILAGKQNPSVKRGESGGVQTRGAQVRAICLQIGLVGRVIGDGIHAAQAHSPIEWVVALPYAVLHVIPQADIQRE